MPDHALLDYLRPRRDEMLAAVLDLVGRETPSDDKTALDALGQALVERLAPLQPDVTTFPTADRGDHRRFAWSFGHDSSIPPALILCHVDTVWPIGTLAERPVRVENGRAYGPGIFDMKASIALTEYALRAIQALDLRPARPVVLLVTTDEEVGSPTSRALIEAEARRAGHALVLEAPLPGGRVKTARKGVGRFTIDITGRAAHAGVEPEKGISAVVELAHQVLRVTDLADRAAGTTVTVGVVQGGSVVNVVPAAASARIDVRVTTMAEAARVEAALTALRPVLAGATITTTGGFNRPPMERTPAVAALFERARTIGATLGLDLGEGATGGASDGNFTAALGVPTLDGLGALGAGAHAVDEHILIDSLPERAALLAALLLKL
ncbi:MAG: M20 family metallopeptidase [Chloroflexi bacterium]|nr:M20 family metallopeptidase [Chloroflexota bacterium]